MRRRAALQRKHDAHLAADPPSPGHMLPLPDNSTEAGSSPDGFFYALLQKELT